MLLYYSVPKSFQLTNFYIESNVKKRVPLSPQFFPQFDRRRYAMIQAPFHNAVLLWIALVMLSIATTAKAQSSGPPWGEPLWSDSVTSDQAKWIWQSKDGPKNTWIAFRKQFELDDVPPTAIAAISTDTKYWLWINGEMVVFEGGLARGPMPEGSYFDKIDLAPHLKSGTNTVAILVWYWGRTAKTHEDSGKGGLLFSADLGDQTVDSNKSWKLKVHPAYDPNSKGVGRSANRPNAMDVKYDARQALGDWTDNAWYLGDYDDQSWQHPEEKGAASSLPWGTLVQRPIPQWHDRGLADYQSLKLGEKTITLPFKNTRKKKIVIRAELPRNVQVTPYLKVRADAGAKIEIGTDDPFNLIEAQYTTTDGEQAFETYSWMNGHAVQYTVPPGVEVLALKYRWTSTEPIAGSFTCSDPFFERLWQMAGNTLHICVRDCYMDCPDRERGLWLGDVADQTGAVFYTLDQTGRLLLKKGIDNTFAYQKGDIIQGLAPGFGAYRGQSSELCAQSLQYISQGIWRYYFNTGDSVTLVNAYPFVKRYLELWKMLPNGMPENRKGYAGWVDWGLNPDPPAVNVCWYHMALGSAKKMAIELGKTDDVDWYQNRIDSIEKNYDAVYWRDGYYGTPGQPKDERVSALAILTGLADREKYDSLLTEVLTTQYNASPHMEWIVEEAIMQTGDYAAGLHRMKQRHADQVSDQGLTTLYERYANDKKSRGTPNHAWNAPNYVLSCYIAGIKATDVGWKTFQVLPNLAHLTSIKQVVPSVKGKIIVDIKLDDDVYAIDVQSPQDTTGVIGIPKQSISPKTITVNGKTVWEDGQFEEGLTGVGWAGEDDKYLKFSVAAGTWSFVAK